jgi:hypothetical protein
MHCLSACGNKTLTLVTPTHFFVLVCEVAVFLWPRTGSRVIEVTDEAHYKKEVDGYAGIC